MSSLPPESNATAGRTTTVALKTTSLTQRNVQFLAAVFICADPQLNVDNVDFAKVAAMVNLKSNVVARKRFQQISKQIKGSVENADKKALTDGTLRLLSAVFVSAEPQINASNVDFAKVATMMNLKSNVVARKRFSQISKQITTSADPNEGKEKPTALKGKVAPKAAGKRKRAKTDNGEEIEGEALLNLEREQPAKKQKVKVEQIYDEDSDY